MLRGRIYHGGGIVTICEPIPRPRVDLLYGGYTITQRIRWLNKREEIRAQLEKEFAELQLGERRDHDRSS